MSEKIQIDLAQVQKTLLLPLWGRAEEMKKPIPLLRDPKAVEIIQSLDYDFSTIAANIHKISQMAWISRSLFFDSVIREFLNRNPEGTIINGGCGLDTTFDRIDNGSLRWFDLDLPEVISLRKKFFQDSRRRTMVSASLLDSAWFSQIPKDQPVIVMGAGVFYYFHEDQVKTLFNSLAKDFSSLEITFDYSSPLGVKIANKKVIENGGMDKNAGLQWGIANIKKIKTWNTGIRILKTQPMFRDFKKLVRKNSLPKETTRGLNLSDTLKIQSLAHIRIE